VVDLGRIATSVFRNAGLSASARGYRCVLNQFCNAGSMHFNLLGYLLQLGLQLHGGHPLL
jgi:hypothetical protein